MITTETAHHSLPDGELTLLGAVSTVTGAMTRVVSGGMRFLVDCGVAQGGEARQWTLPGGSDRGGCCRAHSRAQ